MYGLCQPGQFTSTWFGGSSSLEWFILYHENKCQIGFSKHLLTCSWSSCQSSPFVLNLVHCAFLVSSDQTLPTTFQQSLKNTTLNDNKVSNTLQPTKLNVFTSMSQVHTSTCWLELISLLKLYVCIHQRLPRFPIEAM